MMKTARHIAVEALLKVNRRGGYSNLVLDHSFEKNVLEPRDKAFCCALFYGVLERMLTLDAVIAHYSKLAENRISPAVRELLRVALYQLIYLDGVPQSAAVNESVELSKTLGCAHTAGFINGVLRGFLRDGGTLSPILPDPEREGVAYRSLFYSIPRWLVESLRADYGEARAEGIFKAACGRPPLYLRANTHKVSAANLADYLRVEGMEAAVRPEADGCVEVREAGAIDESRCFRKGLFTVQDLSSQLCAAAVDAGPGQRVADFCAAPGGKTFTMAQLMRNTGELCSFDLHPQKVRLIESGAKRLGLTCVRAAVNDAKCYDGSLGEFDRVLCDVPCSGLGILRRKPEIRYKNPAELEALPEIQYKILETSSKYVRLGGRLIYSTCTLRRAENDEVALRFLREHPAFVPAPLPEPLRAFAEEGDGGPPYRVTLLPEQMDSDGFFLACFARVE